MAHKMALLCASIFLEFNQELHFLNCNLECTEMGFSIWSACLKGLCQHCNIFTFHYECVLIDCEIQVQLQNYLGLHMLNDKYHVTFISAVVAPVCFLFIAQN
jgi:hypothetical protein